MFVLNIIRESLAGKNQTKVVHPASCWLNIKMLQCRKAYVQSLEQNIVKHRLLEQLNKVHCSNLCPKKEGRDVECYQSGRVRLHDTRGENVQKDQMLLHILLTQSVHLDLEGAGVLLDHPMA